MTTVFTSAIAHSLKLTLNEIIDDDLDGIENDLVFRKYCKEKTMEDAFEDDLEMGGPGLAIETQEGQEVQTGTIREGYISRYIARKFALKLIVTDEAMEDKKYPKVIECARRLKRAMWKTVEIDAAYMLARGWTTGYTGGDGVVLFSASHTLPQGGTFSNNLAVAMSPSKQAVVAATTMCYKMVGHDGIVGAGVKPKKIACPVDQWAVWSEITKSEKTPTAGNFAEINVVNKDLDLEIVPIVYWNNTTTNWAMLTDADNGLSFRWKRRPKNRTWVDNDNELLKYSISARWSRGWSDPRCAIGSQA